jgi:hypothetical protein
VMPTEPDAIPSTAEQRKPREMTVEGEATRQILGQAPTTAGVVEPDDFDVARSAYRPQDDPMWLDFDAGDDYDGTDAGDRDFLFGGVVHALGEVQRHGDRTNTLGLLLRGRAREWFGRFHGARAIGDHHAALGGARHHLVQYLAWRLWQREDLLTARAYAPELEAASRRIEAALGTSSGTARRPGDSRTRVRLSRLCDPAQPLRWQRYVVAGALASALGLVGLAIANAVHYHASYVAITKENLHGKN